MNVLEEFRVGNVRLRLVEMPAPTPDLASRHYVISECVDYQRFAAIADVGYHPEQARKSLTYYTERELARLAAERDDGQ